MPKDQYYNNWIFWREGPPRTARDSYRSLQCAVCKKIDEFKAIHLPVEREVKVRSRDDIVGTEDGIIAISIRMKTLLDSENAKGLEYVPLPGDDKYTLIWPTTFLPVDLTKAGFQYDGEKCVGCGRYRLGAYVGPLKESYSLPSDPLLICAPETFSENRISRNLFPLISPVMQKIFKSHKIKGAEYIMPL